MGMMRNGEHASGAVFVSRGHRGCSATPRLRSRRNRGCSAGATHGAECENSLRLRPRRNSLSCHAVHTADPRTRSKRGKEC